MLKISNTEKKKSIGFALQGPGALKSATPGRPGRPIIIGSIGGGMGRIPGLPPARSSMACRGDPGRRGATEPPCCGRQGLPASTRPDRPILDGASRVSARGPGFDPLEAAGARWRRLADLDRVYGWVWARSGSCSRRAARWRKGGWRALGLVDATGRRGGLHFGAPLHRTLSGFIHQTPLMAFALHQPL